MKEERVAGDGYVINGFKPFSQLAMEYFLGNPGIDSTRKRMRERIDQDLSLTNQLTALGYNCHTIYLSPKMQELIIIHLGPPYIIVPNSHPNGPEEKKQ